MPNVNLTDSRSRDAVVKAETTGVAEEIRYVDDEGQSAYTRKILKATVEHDYETLVKKYQGEPDALLNALIDEDPEVDMEICGQYLWGVSKVYVNSSDGIVYRIEQSEIVRGPDGKVKDKRPRQRAEANVDMEIPLTWTGRKIDKSEAVRRFVFASKLQIVHINGLTYDFLFGMAKELAESNALMMIGGGSKGRDPLIFRSGSIPYRGFLEGRVEGDKYILLLHLSNLELKVPAERKKSEDREEEKGAEASVKSKKAEDKAEEKAETKKKKTSKTASEPEKKKPAKKEPEVVADAGEQVVADKEDTPSKISAKKTAEKKTAEKKTANKKDEKSVEEEGRTETDKEDPVEEKPAKEKPGAKKKKAKEPEPVEAAAKDVTNDDLGVWLKSVRMGKYLQLFIDNEIDVDVLPELTDADLKELEIPLGSRRRLLKAVEETDNLRAEVVMAVSAMSGAKKKKVVAKSTKKNS